MGSRTALSKTFVQWAMWNVASRSVYFERNWTGSSFVRFFERKDTRMGIRVWVNNDRGGVAKHVGRY